MVVTEAEVMATDSWSCGLCGATNTLHVTTCRQCWMSTQQTSLYTLRGEPRTPGKSRRRPDERTEAAVDTANMANMTHSCLARLGMRAGLTPLTSEALALDTLETDDADGTGEAGREWQGDAADGGHEGVKGRGRTGSRAESVGSDSVLGSAASPIGGAEVREATRSYNDLLFNSSDRWTTNGTPLWKTADASETVFATHAVLSAKKKKKKKKKRPVPLKHSKSYQFDTPSDNGQDNMKPPTPKNSKFKQFGGISTPTGIGPLSSWWRQEEVGASEELEHTEPSSDMAYNRTFRHVPSEFSNCMHFAALAERIDISIAESARAKEMLNAKLAEAEEVAEAATEFVNSSDVIKAFEASPTVITTPCQLSPTKQVALQLSYGGAVDDDGEGEGAKDAEGEKTEAGQEASGRGLAAASETEAAGWIEVHGARTMTTWDSSTLSRASYAVQSLVERERLGLTDAGERIVMRRSASDASKTAMWVAAEQGNVRMMEWLRRNGGSKELRTRAMGLLSPTHIAVRRGHLQVLEYLRDVGSVQDMSFKTANGVTPLAEACHRGNVKICQFLWSFGSVQKSKPWESDASSSDLGGHTPMWRAASVGALAACQWLVSVANCGHDIHTCNGRGVSPLTIASANGHAHVVEWLKRQVAEKAAAPQTETAEAASTTDVPLDLKTPPPKTAADLFNLKFTSVFKEPPLSSASPDVIEPKIALQVASSAVEGDEGTGSVSPTKNVYCTAPLLASTDIHASLKATAIASHAKFEEAAGLVESTRTPSKMAQKLLKTRSEAALMERIEGIRGTLRRGLSAD